MKNRKLSLRKSLALKLFNKYHEETIQKHELRVLFWECTLRCNLSCLHCGSDCKSDASFPDMPAADFLKVIDSITPHVNPNHVMITFSGGEPLMRKDLEKVGLELYRRGYPWGMVTNGFALDAARFDSLLKSGLHSITVSLDGFAHDHNKIRKNDRSFDKAVEAIRLITREKSIIYDVVTCVNKENLSTLPDFKEFLINEGVTHWRIFTIFPSGRAADNEFLHLNKEETHELMNFIVKTRKEKRIKLDFACEGFLGNYEGEVRDQFYFCKAGVQVGGIKIDGAIGGCTSIRHGFDQGNIYQDDFMDVWNNRFAEYRDRSWTKTDECADCKMFRYCKGGGMHLRDDDRKMMDCLYLRLAES